MRYFERALQSDEQRRANERRVEISAAYTEVVRQLSAWNAEDQLPADVLASMASMFDADGAALRVGDRHWCFPRERTEWAVRLLDSAESAEPPSFLSRQSSNESTTPPGRLLLSPETRLPIRVLAFREEEQQPRIWGRGKDDLPGALRRWEESRAGTSRPWLEHERATATQLDRDLKESLGPLIEARLLLRTVVGREPLAVVLCDRTGVVLDLNPLAQQLLGEDAKGAQLDALIDGWAPDLDIAPELFIRRPGGPRVPVRVSTERHGGGQVERVVFLQDLRELRAVERHLAESRRLEEAATLATGLAHDFNNTLTVVLNNTEMVLDELPALSEERGMLEEVVAAAQSGRGIARDLLVFARSAGQGQGDCSSPGDLLLESQRMLEALLGPGRALSVEVLLEEAVTLRLSPGELQQILFNLVTNSAHSSANRVVIRLELYTGDSVRITVRDDGPGLPDHVLEQAFQPFFTTRARGVGTGLGLYLVAGLVKRAGGTISVRNDGGAVFTLDFPVHEASVDLPGVEAESLEREKPSGSRLQARVLVVEDNELVRPSLVRLLKRHGHILEQAPDAETGLEKIAIWAPEVIVTDLMMPGMSGLELLKTPACSALAAVLITGHKHLSDLGEVLGHVVTLAKPSVEKALQRSR